MAVMAKKKPPEREQSRPDPDRHLHPKITLRLPPPAGDVLRAIAEHEDRTITAIVLRALRAYAQAHGYTWGPSPIPGQRDAEA
jgi:hypothetical protein